MENLTLPVNTTSTFWEFFGRDYLRYNWLITVILIIAYATIFVLGLIGNVTVILVISRNIHMQTVTNIFVRNLAIADLFVELFCVPVTLLANIYKPWVFGTIPCKTLPYTQGVSVFASVYSLVAISADRCRAFYRGSGRPYGFTKSQAKWIIYFIWIFGLIITSPWLWVFTVEYSADLIDYGYPYCVERWMDPQYGTMYFITVHLVICFALPVIVIAVLNLVVWRNMYKFQHMSSDTQLAQRYNLTGITTLLFVITVMFIVNWLPLYLLMTKIKLFGDDPEQLNNGKINYLQYFIPVAQWMGSFNSCINPILYAFNSQRFRECATRYLRRLRRNVFQLFSISID